MTHSNNRKDKNLIAHALILAPEISANLGSVLVTYTTHRIGEDHGEDQYPRYDEIYKIFNTGYFSRENENLTVYQNIHNIDIHHVVARSTLFPYNDVAQWCFKQFDWSTTKIVIQLRR